MSGCEYIETKDKCTKFLRYKSEVEVEYNIDSIDYSGSILIIESFHEFFTEITNNEKLLTFLENIKKIIDKITYDNVYLTNCQSNCIKKTKFKDICKDYKDLINKLLKKQKDDISLSDEILKKNLKDKKNIYLGGVYGDSCVFEKAQELGHNIITRFIPQTGHNCSAQSNIRFFPVPKPVYENVIILSDICYVLDENEYKQPYYIIPNIERNYEEEIEEKKEKECKCRTRSRSRSRSRDRERDGKKRLKSKKKSKRKKKSKKFIFHY